MTSFPSRAVTNEDVKVPLVLKEIEQRTEDPLEKLAINKILQMKESSLRDLDDKMKWLKNFERLLEIQRNVVWPGVMEMEPKQYYPEFLKVKLQNFEFYILIFFLH